MKYLFSLVFLLALVPVGVAHANTFPPSSVSAGGQCDPTDIPTDCKPDAFDRPYTCSFAIRSCVSVSSNPDNSPVTGGATGQPATGSKGGATGQPATGLSGGTGSNGSTGGSGSTCLTNPLSVGGGCGGDPATAIPQFIADLLSFVVRVGSVVVILMLVYVGFLFVVAQGDPGKISEAKQALLYTIIGALILLGAQVIASGIQATVNALSTGS